MTELPKATDNNAIEKEEYMKKIKRQVEGCRELILSMNNFLMWSNTYYPWIIFFATTIIFTNLAYLDLSLLTTVSLIAILITIIEYFSPILITTIWRQDIWTATKERELENICRNIAHYALTVKFLCRILQDSKTTRPLYYFSSVCGTLALLAWITSNINNLFITYIVVLGTLLLPGMMHNGFLDKCIASGIVLIKNWKSNEKKIN